jgi:glycosyltransferase involved in cell wall biosynthesis
VQIGEPFGLVLIEAMACGTPVLALDNGAVSEIVINGLNGFYVRNLSEMVKIFPEILKLNRAGIRSFVVKQFDVRQMVEGYVSIYKQILNVEKKPEFYKSANG